MAKTINIDNLILRNDTSVNWSTANPVLQLGELGIDTTEKKIKIGDGTTPWNDLDFSSSKGAELGTAAPTAADDEFDVGTIWVDTTNDLAYLLYDNTADAAVWKQIVTPDQLEELGAGDMLKAVYATNAKSAQGYVDKAILADTATAATSAAKLTTPVDISLSGDVTGSVSFDGSQAADIEATVNTTFTEAEADANIASGDTLAIILGKLAKFYNTTNAAIAGKQDAITVDADKALISDGTGKVAASTVTATELSYLSGVTGGIQAQLDNIPKYVYLDGIAISIADESEQTAITAAAQAALAEEYPEAVKWNAVTVNVTFTPSDVEIDELFYFDGTSWKYLNKVSTGIQRANGTTAGIVENSADVTFVDGQATVVQAGKVKNALTINGQTFDGSAVVEIDLSALTVGTASKVANALTIDVNGTQTVFDGSAAKTADINIPTASTELTDTAHILYDTDTFVINCGGAAQE